MDAVGAVVAVTVKVRYSAELPELTRAVATVKAVNELAPEEVTEHVPAYWNPPLATVLNVSTNNVPVVVAVPAVTLATPLSCVDPVALATVGLDPAAAPAVMVGGRLVQNWYVLA